MSQFIECKLLLFVQGKLLLRLRPLACTPCCCDRDPGVREACRDGCCCNSWGLSGTRPTASVAAPPLFLARGLRRGWDMVLVHVVLVVLDLLTEPSREPNDDVQGKLVDSRVYLGSRVHLPRELRGGQLTAFPELSSGGRRQRPSVSLTSPHLHHCV